MVGDALETDVTGAAANGIDSIWVVNNGIHNEDIAKQASSSSLNDDDNELTRLEYGCRAVLDDFNKVSETSYAAGRQLSPSILLPDFQW